MAKQTGSLQIRGTIGNLTYFKSEDGYMVKAKSAVSADKIKSDPKFARTRENMAEFGNAGKSGKNIRNPFTSLLQGSADNRMVSRLVATCMNVLHTDTISKRGKRIVAKGDLSLFTDFEFNKKGILSTTLLAPYTVSFVRTTGVVTFDLPVFTPSTGIAAPQGATHYQVQIAAASVNISSRKNKSEKTASAILPWDDTPTTDLSLSVTLAANSTDPVFVLVQILFFVQLNAEYYPLQNGAYNACAIAEVDEP